MIKSGGSDLCLKLVTAQMSNACTKAPSAAIEHTISVLWEYVILQMLHLGKQTTTGGEPLTPSSCLTRCGW